MKFAVLALLGLVQAGDFQIPQIDINQTKVDVAAKDLAAWAKRDEAARKQDN